MPVSKVLAALNYLSFIGDYEQEFIELNKKEK